VERREDGAKREMYRGMGDGFAMAFELAATPTLFGLAGYWIDRRLDLVPLFTTLLALLALLGLAARMWYGYQHRMEAIEASGPWAKPVPVPAPGAEEPAP
jgi:F0F1-type ATP synthase assembly protein I